MELWMLIALVMTTELGLHYFPWKLLLKGRELPRVAAYTLGLLGLMLPFTAWLWLRQDVDVIQVLWMVIISGGLTVFALYGLDRYIELEWKHMEACEREHASRNSTDVKEN